MKILILFVIFIVYFLIQFSSKVNGACTTDADCDNGKCDTASSKCQCTKGYATFNNVSCNYEQKSKLTAFLVSFLAGGIGVDWFYLANGNGGYIAAGVFKLLTCGGAGIWYTVDWIRILCDTFKDGNGVALNGW